MADFIRRLFYFHLKTNLTNTIQQINIENQYSNVNTIQITNQEQNLASIVPIENEEKKEEFWVPIPYIGNASNKVAGYLRNRLNWKVTFTPGVKVQNFLNSIKDKEEKEPAGVYKIPCNSCDSIYLGESLRFVERINDHEGNVRRQEYRKSTVARHIIRNRNHKSIGKIQK